MTTGLDALTRKRLWREARLWGLAILVTLVLSGNRTIFSDHIIMHNTDLFPASKLTDSAMLAVISGQFPPLTAEGMFGDSGNPVHLFYSPLVYMFTGYLALFLGSNPFLGLMAASLFMMVLGFVSAFKLCRYLTRSRTWGYVGAFLFVTAPHMAICQHLRGAYAEYFAMCVLPLVMYCLARLWARFTLTRFLCAVFAWIALFHIHLITSFFTIVFLAFFWALHCVWLWRQRGAPGAPSRRRKFLARTARSVAMGLLALLASSWTLMPTILYRDLAIRFLLGWQRSSLLAHYSTIFSALSATDAHWGELNLSDPMRVQVGVWLLASLFGFAYFNWRNKSSLFAQPLAITAAFILFLVVTPVDVFVGPLRHIDIAQYSGRYLTQLSLLLALLGALALRRLVAATPGFTAGGRVILALIVIVTSVIFVIPYLQPRTSNPGQPEFIYLPELRGLDNYGYGTIGYFRSKRAEPFAPLAEWGDRRIHGGAEMRSTADRTYRVDLEKQAAADDWDGSLVFDVLYYPGLQTIEAVLDGKPFTPAIGTYWTEAGDRGPLYHPVWWADPERHFLMLEQLPNQGKLSLRVAFIGDRRGNILSLASFGVLFALILYQALIRLTGKGNAGKR